MVHGEVGVRKRLRLHALARVHDEQRALAGGQRAADLVVEVHVARRVNEVERILLAVSGLVREADGAGLYRYAALFFEIHVVEDLALHLAGLDGPAELYEPVRERALAVVDVGDYAEIPDVVLIHLFMSSAICSTLSARARSSAATWAPQRAMPPVNSLRPRSSSAETP